MSDEATTLPRWATAADALTVLLALLGSTVAVTGGIRFLVAGLIVSVTSGERILAAACVVAVLRHAVCRRPSLGERVSRVARVEAPLPDIDPWTVTAPSLSLRELAVVGVAMVGLTVVMTYPQVLHLRDVRDAGDPLFSIWRLSWIAHQLPRDPLHLFDANIFYPERDTLALSDSILLPGIAGAPFLWLGVPGVVFYNVYVMATFVFAGVAMYVLVRELTGCTAAAAVGAVIFAFYPFRFQHYSHFELQFSFWMPLALLALHRTVASGRLRDGLLTGAAVAGQTLSSIYFGIFLATYMAGVWLVATIGSPRLKASLKPLVAGGGLAVLLAVPLAAPYLHVRASIGERALSEVEHYSARPSSYLEPHPSNATYSSVIGNSHHDGETLLFPGLLAVALALAAMWPPLSTRRMAYTVGLLLAFEASLGTHGYLFTFLYHDVAPYRGLRVPARFSMLVGLSLSVLAGYAVARWSMRLRPAPRWLLAAILVAGILFESRATLTFEPVAGPRRIDVWLNALPPSVVAELPVPSIHVSELWRDVRFSYLSTFHWQRLLNGNSGSYPDSYLAFVAFMQTFPDDRSMAFLRARRVDYVVINEEFYGREPYRAVIEAVAARRDLQPMTSAVSHGWEARIYRVAR